MGIRGYPEYKEAATERFWAIYDSADDEENSD